METESACSRTSRCDFISDGAVTPQTSTVSYVADVSGGVTKPVQGGNWKVRDDKRLEFTLKFPEELRKKDVTIPEGSDLVMDVNLISTKALKQLEVAFSEARKEEWKALEKIDEIQAIRNSPKRWNDDTQRWEYPRVEPLSSLFSKHCKRVLLQNNGTTIAKKCLCDRDVMEGK